LAKFSGYVGAVVVRLQYTVKKRGVLPNPKKGSGDVEKYPVTSKVSKKNKKIYETFKGSSRVSRGRTFFYETFF
jgi:hypothetical protein